MEQPAANSASLERLVALADRIDADALRRVVRDDWTAAALLLHIAFWDRLTAARWRDAAARRRSTPSPIDDELVDVLNDALLQLTAAIPPEEAGAVAVAAAREVDALIADLPASAIEEARSEGRPRLVDRSAHRDEHLAEIESALGPR